MKNDFEVLHEYIDKYDKDFFKSLSDHEKILYACEIRDTLSFSLYLLRYRILEFCSFFVDYLKGGAAWEK